MGNWSFAILLHYNSVILRSRASLYLNTKAVDYWTKVFYFDRPDRILFHEYDDQAN